MRWVVFVQDNIGDQPDPSVKSFDQIVAEQCIFRHSSGEAAFEGVNFVDALADVAAFAEQILIG